MNTHLASKLFTPITTGPPTLHNRAVRSAAFGSMCPGNAPSPMLFSYHRSVAAGGIRMTTVAYASMTCSGLSFSRQLWLRPEITPGLRELTDVIRAEGVATSIRIGHCGNMSHESIHGVAPVSASSGFNIYSPTWVRGMRWEELPEMAKAYRHAVCLTRKAGSDAVEVHAEHGYLISQFLPSCTNRRKDEYGGSLESRMRFMTIATEEVIEAAGSDIAVFVKMNIRDGFHGDVEIEGTPEVARRLESLGGYALVSSGDFVNKAPMYVMRRTMPIRTLTHYMDCWWLKYGAKLTGQVMISTIPFKEAYFLEDALRFHSGAEIPLIYVGRLVSHEKVDEVLNEGFEVVQMACALLSEPGSVDRIRREEKIRCNCGHSNYRIGRTYTVEMACHHHLTEELPPCLQKEVEHLENR